MRHLLATTTVVALLVGSAGAVGAQEASPEPGASPTPEQLTEAEERLATATCLGKPATIVAIAGVETVGTPAGDVIVGTEGDDIIRGGGGNDRICAGAGDDLVDGGAGKDRIDGGAGDDTLDGGPGNDAIDGGKGADLVTGAADDDRLSGGRGDDTLDGGMGSDVCDGGKGHDWLPGCNDKRRTKGKLVVKRNTTLKGPHRGSIVVAADKVTLDCGGHAVMGPGGGIGISVIGWNGNTVENCDVTNFGEGIRTENAQRNTLTRNRVRGNSVEGIKLEGTFRNKVTWNVADDNGEHGFEVLSSRKNVFRNNSASSRGGVAAGFAVGNGSSRNTFEDNTVTGGSVGFHIFEGSRNKFRNNSVTRTDGGFNSEVTTNDNVFADNAVTEIRANDAYRIAGFGHTIARNTAIDNLGIGFKDESMPGANSYSENICINNSMGDAVPEGLCDDTIPVEPEPSPEPGDSSDSDGASAAEE